MMRLMVLIGLSFVAGILIHSAVHRSDAPPPVPFVSSSPDVAAQLRTLTGAGEPNKLWAHDFAAFVTAHSGQWVVGRCQEPCLSEAEAARDAHSDAARFVWPIVLSRFSAIPADSEWLRARIAADVAAGRLDADTLAEKFERPYGAVWTESVLLDVSPARIDSLLNSYKSDRRMSQRHLAKDHEMLLIAVVGSWLAYLFLNAVTKGYFTMRLRLAAAMVTALGVALLV
jgi:hypothetical protein